MDLINNWKEGISRITPEQQLKASQKGNWVMLIGIICGIVATFFKLKDYWWIEIILIASLFNHSIAMLGVHQKIVMINKFNQEVTQNV